MKKKSFAILLAAALLLCLLPRMAPEAKAETIRNICSFCNTRAYHEITGFERYNDDQHWVIHKCPNCGESERTIFLGNPVSYHSGGTETPTCTTAKPAPSAALNTANSVTTGAHGNPGATTVSISAPASATAAMRWTLQAAPATAAQPALRWEHALPAAGSTTAHIPSLRIRAGIRMPKTTGLAAPSATKRKLRWAHISSFRATIARALSPQPPAFLRPCTTQTALTATARERILMYTHGMNLTRTTTT